MGPDDKQLQYGSCSKYQRTTISRMKRIAFNIKIKKKYAANQNFIDYPIQNNLLKLSHKDVIN